jgi:hypothetical protein
MAWLRSPVLYGIALLVIGMIVRAALSMPETARVTTIEDLQRAMVFQRDERPLQKLEPHYRPFAFAFVFAASESDVEAIKRGIDAEFAAGAEVSERGLAGVPDYVAERLASLDIVLMALGAALVFRGMAFVLATGFAAGLYHELVMQSALVTGAPSEYYLAAIIAALMWCTLFWALRALYERRLRFSR